MATKPPRISGSALRAARIAAETPGSDVIVREVMKRGLGIDKLAGLPESFRGDIPTDTKPVEARAKVKRERAPAPAPTRSFPRNAEAYTSAYRAKTVTPTSVAERALSELERLGARRPTMNVLTASDRDLTRRDASRSSERYAQGAPLGPLDGVLFLVKDEFDVEGMITTLGSRAEREVRAACDSTVVARLRRAGAVFAGKTVLTEWGMSPIGGNVNQTMPHNAHDASRAPGGSSTGSAVGVALGIAPLATAGDGGGSIRIPASLNGIFGIKPTFGRVSRAGDGFKGSVAHAGVVGTSTWDLVAFMDAVASEPDPEDTLTAWAPAAPEGGFGARLGAGVRGLRIGVDENEWKDAAPAVARAGREALAALEKDGATLVSVSTPIMRYAPMMGYLTIGPESLAAHREAWLEQRDKITDDVRLVFAVLSGFTSMEQLDAQRLRAGLRREVAALLRTVDFIALPTTGITAPRYTEDDEKTSFSDPAALDGLCRYAFLGNLTGLPAATAPVGADESGLPIGLQIVGDAWDELGVLSVLAHLERSEVARVRRPASAIDLLG